MRFIYKDLRQKFVDILRNDLIGPYEEDEELRESPTSSYTWGVYLQKEKTIHLS